MRTVAWLIAWGCVGGVSTPLLALDGPDRVRVQSLGPVDGPTPVLPGGESVSDVVWTVTPDTVAQLGEGGVIEAIGPGEAVIRGDWQGQSVSWILVVEPAILLVFREAPAHLTAGQTATLNVEGRLDEKVVDTGMLKWSTSDSAIAVVDELGVLTAVAPGMVYVSAASSTGEAMLELTVSAP